MERGLRVQDSYFSPAFHISEELSGNTLAEDYRGAIKPEFTWLIQLLFQHCRNTTKALAGSCPSWVWDSP